MLAAFQGLGQVEGNGDSRGHLLFFFFDCLKSETPPMFEDSATL